ncbi:MAG: hypothetical protein AABX70_04480 [Nanoarchaeota archaeon]
MTKKKPDKEELEQRIHKLHQLVLVTETDRKGSYLQRIVYGAQLEQRQRIETFLREQILVHACVTNAYKELLIDTILGSYDSDIKDNVSINMLSSDNYAFFDRKRAPKVELNEMLATFDALPTPQEDPELKDLYRPWITEYEAAHGRQPILNAMKAQVGLPLEEVSAPDEEILNRAFSVIQGFPERRRRMLELLLVVELPLEEVAKHMDMRRSTAERELTNTLSALQKAYTALDIPITA